MSHQKDNSKVVPKQLSSFGFTPLSKDQLELMRLKDQVTAQENKIRKAAEAEEKQRQREENLMQMKMI